MSMEYWLAYQSNQIDFFLYHFRILLISMLYYGVALWCFRRKTLGKFEKWLDFRPEIIAKHKRGHLMFSSSLMAIFVIFCSFLLVLVIALQTDINHGLPCDQRTGIVTLEFALFRGRTYAFVDGKLYTYQNSLIDEPLHEGGIYEITYLQHSGEIFRVSQLSD